MLNRTKIYIGGLWVDPVDSELIDVENPATEEIIATVPSVGSADVDRAVQAAREALPEWSITSPTERAAVIRRVVAVLARRSDEMATTIAAEMGCPIKTAQRIQAALPQTILESYAALLTDFEFESRVGNSVVRREPAGIVAAITPWNYPLHQIVCKLAPALAAGCTFVLKPSEIAPLSAYLLFDILDEAGVPSGVVNLVPGTGSVVGAALAAHPDINVISFTGSTRAGVKVAEAAARNVTRACLELGGKSANVLLPDADLDKAVKVGVSNAFLNGGQTCTAWTRMLVHDSMYDEAVKLAAEYAVNFVPGDPMEQATRLGPMASKAQQEQVMEYVRIGVSEGARVIAGGAERPTEQERGHYVQATILADVAPDSRVAQEEIFGPVLCLIRYSDEDEALAIANNSEYGLAGGVWSADQERAIAFAAKMQTGAVDINGGTYNPIAPFGGYKKSGIGRELGIFGLEEFLEIKAIQL